MGSFFYDVDRVSWHFWNNYRTSMLPFIHYLEKVIFHWNNNPKSICTETWYFICIQQVPSKKSPTCITMKKVMVRPRPKEVTRTTNNTKKAVPHCCNFNCSTLPACPRWLEVFKGLREIHTADLSWRRTKKYVGYFENYIYIIHCFPGANSSVDALNW